VELAELKKLDPEKMKKNLDTSKKKLAERTDANCKMDIRMRIYKGKINSPGIKCSTSPDINEFIITYSPFACCSSYRRQKCPLSVWTNASTTLHRERISFVIV